MSQHSHLTFLLPHCGPCDNFCYLGHIKKLVDDDDDDMENLTLTELNKWNNKNSYKREMSYAARQAAQARAASNTTETSHKHRRWLYMMGHLANGASIYPKSFLLGDPAYYPETICFTSTIHRCLLVMCKYSKFRIESNS